MGNSEPRNNVEPRFVPESFLLLAFPDLDSTACSALICSCTSGKGFGRLRHSTSAVTSSPSSSFLSQIDSSSSCIANLPVPKYGCSAHPVSRSHDRQAEPCPATIAGIFGRLFFAKPFDQGLPTNEIEGKKKFGRNRRGHSIDNTRSRNLRIEPSRRSGILADSASQSIRRSISGLPDRQVR